MPKIVEEQSFDGAEALIDRLGLDDLLAEVRGIITGFALLVEEKKDSNGAAALRKMIDERFRAAGGWVKKTVRGGEKRRHLRRDKAEPGSQFRESPLAGIGKDSA